MVKPPPPENPIGRSFEKISYGNCGFSSEQCAVSAECAQSSTRHSYRDPVKIKMPPAPRFIVQDAPPETVDDGLGGGRLETNCFREEGLVRKRSHTVKREETGRNYLI